MNCVRLADSPSHNAGVSLTLISVSLLFCFLAVIVYLFTCLPLCSITLIYVLSLLCLSFHTSPSESPPLLSLPRLPESSSSLSPLPSASLVAPVRIPYSRFSVQLFRGLFFFSLPGLVFLDLILVLSFELIDALPNFCVETVLALLFLSFSHPLFS